MNKLTLLKSVLTCGFIWIGACTIYSQVTVGSGTTPNKGVLLDIKQYDDATAKSGGRTADKGLALPRVALSDAFSLDDIDPTNATRPVPERHIGLTVYNVTDDTATGGILKEGTYMWDGTQWQLLGLRAAQGFGPWYKVDDPTLPSRNVDENSYLDAKTVIGGKLILGDADLSVYGKTILNGGSVVGTGTSLTKGALLEVKTQDAESPVTDVTDNTNITSTNGGLLMPRVKITGLSTLDGVIPGGDAFTTEEKLKLAGLTVYNINRVSGYLYQGVYVWNGTSWAYLVDSKISTPLAVAVNGQPKAFSFYETGDEIVNPLTFTVNPPIAADGTIGTVTYQWYQVTGNNVHVRVGTPIGTGTVTGTGATTNTFTPSGVLKGTTRIASNNGFYKFYCVAKSGTEQVVSDIVEVAVGCGAKDINGEWYSFMCFNLGCNADEASGIDAGLGMTIAIQKSTVLPAYSYNSSSGAHTYVSGEEKVWGSLFQWGRIPDGHQHPDSPLDSRGSAVPSTEIVSGNYCTASSATGSPYNQVSRSSINAYGKFVKTTDNWQSNTNQAVLDQIWRAGRFTPNDPCAHYTKEGVYSSFWNDDTTMAGTSEACTDTGTGWRLPSQLEWGALFKGGTLVGTPSSATANTWKFYNPQSGNTNLTRTKGIDIMPDNETVTLFLPTGGTRHQGGGLYNPGAIGVYWSSSVQGNTTAFVLRFADYTISPAYGYVRAAGGSIRCIKNT